MTAILHEGDANGEWWSSLTHGGLLIAPGRLAEFFSTPLEPLPWRTQERLRRDITRIRQDEKYIGPFLDTLLEEVLGLAVTAKESAVERRWSRKLLTGESYRPSRLWLGKYGDVFPIFVVRVRGEQTPRLGVGRGRREVSKATEWLRLSDQPVGLLTNGRQFRLIHAGADYSAWCEWDVDQWLVGGTAGPQVEAARRLLGVATLAAPAQGARSPLVEAILASRRGQVQLSAALGERVRQAVETLIRASAHVIDPLLEHGNDSRGRLQPLKKEIRATALSTVTASDVYVAATRIVMRIVVVLFAEARDLLPRDNPLYHRSYGIQGLREQLRRDAGGRKERLRHRFASWPRLLGLFRLVAMGSAHEELPIPAYGGGLFELGLADSADTVSGALAAFESPRNVVTDETVGAMIDLLTTSPVRVRQGRGSTTVLAPVDFSDLSSEYLGILYEGLLDFELKRVPDGDTFAFLNVGDEPVLPLSRLEKMDGKALASLFAKLKAKPSNDDDDSGDEAEEAEDDLIGVEAESVNSDSTEQSVVVDDDKHREARQRVTNWAKKAVVAAGLVKIRRGREPDAADVDAAQRVLVNRVLTSGEWFLVRWGGTRKGAGTFYTRPQLAGATARRTLKPLAYNVLKETLDEQTGLMEPSEWAPKKPEEILALKVCDPAMGSGSFLVSALRFMSQALMESLFLHGRLESKVGNQTVCRLADGAVAGHPKEELLPVPKDHPEFEDRLLARLKRHVVEVCIYGVDIDPVAVELARLSLWIETMDRSLPFEFLDHKLKAGNALVGCWFDRFQDYPIAAWEREGGDKSHSRFVHHFRTETRTGRTKKGNLERRGDKWTAAIADFAAARIYPELAALLREQHQPSFTFGAQKVTATTVHDEARKAIEQMRRLAVHEVDRRAELYVSRFRNNEAIQEVRRQFDAWCALWFWPGDSLDLAPTPRQFATINVRAAAIVDALANEHRFFHWELEYPDVFIREGGGFDAVVGNPPWDIQKPNSKEFFSNYDPLFRAYGKQEALDVQEYLFKEAAAIEQEWVRYQAVFKARSNWVKHAGRPFGDPVDAEDGKGLVLVRGSENAELHATWRNLRRRRRGYSDAAHPFLYQGSADLNTYKMFLETAHALLQDGGHLGLLLPASVYGDSGSEHLRRLLTDSSGLSLLYGFQNEKRVFAGVHHAFKMCCLFALKKTTANGFRTLFRLGIAGSPTVDEIASDLTTLSKSIWISKAQAIRFSPSSRTIVELRSARDLVVVDKIFTSSALLGDPTSTLAVTYARELDMTNDSALFPPRPVWEARGYIPDRFGNWLQGRWRNAPPESGSPDDASLVRSQDGTRIIELDDIADVALPLYEGRSVGQFDFQRKGWVSGKGRRAIWRELSFGDKRFEPQFCIGAKDYLEAVPSGKAWKVAFMDVAASNVERTAIATPLFGLPCGNSAPTLVPLSGRLEDALVLSGVMNSFAYDFFARQRCTGLHLNWFIVSETPIPRTISTLARTGIELSSARLSLGSTAFAPAWQRELATRPSLARVSWESQFALSVAERVRLRAIIDALVADAYALSESDFKYILQDTDFPADRLSDRGFASTIDSKRFWLVDRDRPPELRQTVLAYVAFSELRAQGIEAFLALNEGEGWMLPEHLCLSSYGLGHDERAANRQEVASALGPRFLDSQVKSAPKDSWERCARYSEQIDAIACLAVRPRPQGPGDQHDSVDRDLFGKVVATRRQRGR